MTYPHPMDDKTGFEATDAEMGLVTQDRRYAKDVADWCQRSLDEARATGRMETRPFVQNAALIITALRAYSSGKQTP